MFFKDNRKYFIISVITIVVLVVAVGCKLLKDTPNKKMKNEENIDTDITEDKKNDANKIKTNLVDDNIISIGTDIMYITKYRECNHEKVEKEKPTEDMIGLSREEFEKYVDNNMTDWKLELFSKDEINLISEKGTLCTKHFVLGEKDGKITIFKIDEHGERVIYKLYKDTSISTLKEEEQKKLKEGIVVDTEEEAIGMLENYIS